MNRVGILLIKDYQVRIYAIDVVLLARSRRELKEIIENQIGAVGWV